MSVIGTKFSAFMIGVAQKCIVAAIKKWKENRDKTTQDDFRKSVDEYEYAKSVGSQLETLLTVSVQKIQINEEQADAIIALENDPRWKDGLIDEYLGFKLTPERLFQKINAAKSDLESSRESLLSFCENWMASLEKTIGNDPALHNILNLRAHAKTSEQLVDIKEVIVRQGENEVQRDNHIIQEILKGVSSIVRTNDENNVSVQLNTQNQRRFERAKTQLLTGSIALAEQEYAGLIEDLEPLNLESDLLLRSYINLGSCRWEQGNSQGAIEAFNKAFALNPSDWRARRSRAIALMDSSSAEALVILESLRKERPHESEHVCNIAAILKSNGNEKEALQLLEEVAFTDENYLSSLTLAYLDCQKIDEAVACARKALESHPESWQVKLVLAYSLGLPFVRRKMNDKTQLAIPSALEYSNVKEAILLMQGVVSKLKEQQRKNILSEALLNLSAFWEAVKEPLNAIGPLREVLDMKPADSMALNNLWCVQMMVKDFNAAAATAALIESKIDVVDGWKRKIESLIFADRSREVVEEWGARVDDGRFNKSQEIICHIAKALSDRHRTEDGIKLLSEKLIEFPDSSRLLIERALLYEEIGKVNDAVEDILLATRHCKKDEWSLRIAIALFSYRRKEWDNAASMFEALGAASSLSPLFTQYIICLFNSKQYRECLRLVEPAISQSKEFCEDHYAVAARCQDIYDNIPRALKLLDTLVEKSGDRDNEYRKHLAWIYWRRDEIKEAYGVLQKALKLDDSDLDLLLLMSAVCTRRNLHGEALSMARRACGKYPDNTRAHAAMVSSAFACPEGFEMSEEDRDAHFKSLSILQNDGSGILKAIPVGKDCESILALVKARANSVRDAEAYYLRHKLPMGFLATQVGRSIFQLWSSLLVSKNLQIPAALGDPEEQSNEFVASSQAKSISIDYFALLTLTHVDCLEILPKVFSRICVHTSILDAVIDEIRELEKPNKQGTLAYVNGRFLMEEFGNKAKEKTLLFLHKMRDFLKSEVVTLIGLSPEIRLVSENEIFLERCGAACFAPLLVAKEGQSYFYSDDVMVRKMALFNYQVTSFGTQAVLRVARERGVISNDFYQDAIIRLIKSNYFFISEDSGTLKRAYVLAGGRCDSISKGIINHISDGGCLAESCSALLAEFAFFVWVQKTNPGGETREVWMGRIWRAILEAKMKETILMEFISRLAIVCFACPYTFAGILNHSLFDVDQVKRYRRLIYWAMLDSAATMERVLNQSHPHLSSVIDQWRSIRRINRLLRKQGFISLDTLKKGTISLFRKKMRK